MEDFMTIGNNKHIFYNVIEPKSRRIFFSRILDRRVMGSMNDLIFQAMVYLIEKQKPPFDVSILINKNPMSYLKYSSPRKEFQKLYLPEKEPTKPMQKKYNVIHINNIRAMKTK